MPIIIIIIIIIINIMKDYIAQLSPAARLSVVNNFQT